MKLLDLTSQYHFIQKEIDVVIHRILENSEFVLGEDLELLEQEVAHYCGAPYAVGVNSGTDALFFALKAEGIGDGDEVITTPFTFIATAEMIVHAGAKPVFVDIDPQTYNINVHKIEEKITSRTRAIMPVHLFGQPVDMDPILAIAKKHNLVVIEDAAQAIGAEYKGRRSCSMGKYGCLSFFPAKNLGCYGDGGMILTQDETMAEKMKMLRNHGSKIKYYHEFLGYSSRLDNLQAAILRVKLKYIDEWNNLRIEKAKVYNDFLKDIPGIICPKILPQMKMVYQQYTIRVAKRDALRDYLETHNIPSAVHYPLGLHLQPVFQNLGLRYTSGDFPETEKASREVISLPIYPELSHEDIERITAKIIQWVRTPSVVRT